MTQTTASIPVDLRNPGQVLACMGFMEAAEVLLGGVEGHFEWSAAQATFVLRADGDKNPYEVVLEFLSNAKIIELTPIGYVEGGAADGDDEEEVGESQTSDDCDDDSDGFQERDERPTFPSGEGERNVLPIQLRHEDHRLTVSHWADGSSRDNFKLYSGNRSAKSIATQMLQGVREKPKGNQSTGALKYRGLQQLWQEQREAMLKAPFDVITPMGGSFNFDPRGAWTAIDAGYSPNDQKHAVAASPVVEILAAIGLEHARPDQYETRRVRYAVWGHPLPPMLARAALVGARMNLPMRQFTFELTLSGKNKIVTFAKEEPTS